MASWTLSIIQPLGHFKNLFISERLRRPRKPAFAASHNPRSNSDPAELLRYINLKLVALGQPSSHSTTDPYFLEIARPLLRNYYRKDQLLGDRLCPADTRIQQFLDANLKDVCSSGAARLPSNSFVLDRPGLARVMSLPPGADEFASPYLRS